MRRATVLFLVAISCLTNGCWQGTGQDGDPDTSTDADVDVDGDTDADTEVDTDVDTDADGDGDSDSDSDSDADADTDTDTDTSTSSTTGWEIVWQSSAGCLYGVWGTDDENVVAVGTSSGWYGYLLDSLDGQWQGTDLPISMLGDVWFEGTNRIFAGSLLFPSLHWLENGEWNTEGVSGGDGVIRFWSNSDNELFLMSDSSIWRVNPEGETGDMLAPFETQPPSKNLSIWGFDPDQLRVAGSLDGFRDVWSYSGGTWVPMQSGIVGNSPLGIWGSDTDDLFVANGNSGAPGWQGWGGEIRHFDGESWSEMSIPTDAALNAVFGYGPDDVYAVGWWGTILHYDGVEWTLMESGTDLHLWDIWGASPDSVWVVGGTISPVEGVILHHTAE